MESENSVEVEFNDDGVRYTCTLINVKKSTVLSHGDMRPVRLSDGSYYEARIKHIRRDDTIGDQLLSGSKTLNATKDRVQDSSTMLPGDESDVKWKDKRWCAARILRICGRQECANTAVPCTDGPYQEANHETGSLTSYLSTDLTTDQTQPTSGVQQFKASILLPHSIRKTNINEVLPTLEFSTVYKPSTTTQSQTAGKVQKKDISLANEAYHDDQPLLLIKDVRTLQATSFKDIDINFISNEAEQGNCPLPYVKPLFLDENKTLNTIQLGSKTWINVYHDSSACQATVRDVHIPSTRQLSTAGHAVSSDKVTEHEIKKSSVSENTYNHTTDNIYTDESKRENSLTVMEASNSSEKQKNEQNILFPKTCQVAMASYNKSNKSKRQWDKKFMCCFCKIMVAKIVRHLESKHNNEILVKRFCALPKNSRERLLIITKLRSRGKFMQNHEALRKGGVLVPKRRPGKGDCEPKDYLPCEYCGDFYIKKVLKTHHSRCILSNSSLSHKRLHTRGIRSRAAFLLPVGLKTSNSLQANILQKMRHDKVYDTIVEDKLIIEFGNSLFNNYGHLKKNHQMIKDKLRELGRLMIEIKCVDGTINCLDDVIHPERYSELLTAVKSLTGFDETTHQFKVPSLALKLGKTIIRCATVLKSNCFLDNKMQERMTSIDNFIFVMKSQYDEDIVNKSRASPIDSHFEIKKIKTSKQKSSLVTQEISNNSEPADIKLESTFLSVKKPLIKRPWSNMEQDCVAQQYSLCINQTGRVPGKYEIEKFIKSKKNILNNRNWRDVKNFIWNAIKKIKLKSNCFMVKKMQETSASTENVTVAMKSKYEEEITNKACATFIHSHCEIPKLDTPEEKSNYLREEKSINSELTNNKLNYTNVSIKTPIIKRPWSKAEQSCVRKHFALCINQTGRVPGKYEIEKFIKSKKNILNNRNWRDVKNFIWNAIKKKTQETSASTENVTVVMKSKYEEEITKKACATFIHSHCEIPKLDTPEKKSNYLREEKSNNSELTNNKLNSTNGSIKTPIIKRPWSKAEQSCVRQHFSLCINQTGRVPGKYEIEEFLKCKKNILNNRNWRDVKNFIWNIIKKIKRKSNCFQNNKFQERSPSTQSVTVVMKSKCDEDIDTKSRSTFIDSHCDIPKPNTPEQKSNVVRKRKSFNGECHNYKLQSTNSSIKKIFIRRPWSKVEQHCVRKHFSLCINETGRIPGKLEIEEFIMGVKNILNNRNWRDVKTFIWNDIRKTK